MSEQNHLARQAAYAAVAEQMVEPTALVEYTSQGRVLVIGRSSVLQHVRSFAAPLQVTILLQEKGMATAANVVMAANREIEIRGHLGDFEVSIAGDAEHSPQLLSADMILDCNRLPLMDREILPPGYVCSAAEADAMSVAEQTLQDFVGTFEKPRFFAYNADICAHSRSGIAGCTRCLDACPAEAISSDQDAIQVDPYLCQGGGVCATVCPTGAIRYRYPSAEDTCAQIRSLIRTYLDSGGRDANLVLCAEADKEALPELADNCLVLYLEELASVGFEAWLSALAYGASAVSLYDGASVPRGVRAALEQQIEMCQAILKGMGHPTEVLQLFQDSQALEAGLSQSDFQTASFAALEDKRSMAYLAIDHLVQQASTVEAVIPLPAMSPFGRISVDHETCTLCMGCTSVCPASAVTAGNGVPQLNFDQAACVQCGMCARACPEQAISLHAELMTDALQRSQQQVLNEDEPFCCINCGKAFATRSVIDVILNKLAGHAMFQGEREKSRLKMCEDCRVIDMVEDPSSELMQ